MPDIADLGVRFRPIGDDAVVRSMDTMDSRLNGLVSRINRAGGFMRDAFSTATGVLIAQAADRIVDLGKGFITAHASAEQYAISLETVTQSQERANRLMADLQKFAAATPFEFPELVQASINLEAFGLKTEAWLDTIGNTAAAMNKSVDQVTQGVMDASTGEYERLKELGIKARVEGDNLVLQYRDRTETINKHNKDLILSTIQGFWNEGYAGAMKRQAKTFNGMFSTLRDNWKMTMQRLTKGFFGMSKGVLDGANRFFDRFNRKMDQGLGLWRSLLSSLHTTLNQTFGRGIGDAVIGVLRTVGDGVVILKDFAGGLIDAFESGKSVNALFRDLPEPLQAVARIFGEVADAAGDVFRGFQVGGIGEAVSRLFGEIGEAITKGGGRALNVAIDVGVSIASWAISSAENLYDRLTRWVFAAAGGKELVGDATGGPEPMGAGIPIGTIAVQVLDWAISSAKDLASSLSDWVKDKGALFIEAVEIVVRGPVTVEDTGPGGEAAGRSTAEKIAAGIRAAANAIWEATKFAILQLPFRVGEIAGQLTGMGLRIVADLARGIAQRPELLAAAFVGAVTAGAALFVLPPAIMGVMAFRMIQGLITGLNNEFYKVTNWLETSIAAIPQTIGDVSGALYYVGVHTIEGLIAGAQDTRDLAFGPVLDALPGWIAGKLPIGTLLTTLYGKGIALIQGLMSGWTAKSNELAGWAQGFGGWVAGQVGDLSGALWNAGFNLVWGMAQGIYAGRSQVVNAAIDVATAAINALLDRLGIGSPSKVMIDLFRHVPEGAAIGMMQGLRDVQAAANRMAAASLPRFTVPPLPTPSFAGAAAAASSAPSYAGMGLPMRSRGGIGGRQEVHNHYYDLGGAILTSDAVRFVQDQVARGVAKEVPGYIRRDKMAGR